MATMTTEQATEQAIEPSAVDETNQGSQTKPTKEQKTLVMPTSAIKRIREEEKKKGHELAMSELNQRAKKLGFKSWEDMEKAAERNKRGASSARQAETTSTREARSESQRREPEQRTQGNPQRPQNQGNTSSRELQRLQKENERLEAERRRLNQARAHEEKKRRRLQQEFDATVVEHQLRVAAARHGVKDVDFAIHLLRENTKGRTFSEHEAFDEDKFFGEQLRKERPYLFGVADRPANTTATPSSVQGAKAPPAPKTAPVQGERFDAMKASPQEYQARLRALGVSTPGFGSPL